MVWDDRDLHLEDSKFLSEKTTLVAHYIKGVLKEIPVTLTIHVWNTKKAVYQTESKMNKEQTQRYLNIAPHWLKSTNSELNISGIIFLCALINWKWCSSIGYPKITLLLMRVRNQVKIRIKRYILEVHWTWQMISPLPITWFIYSYKIYKIYHTLSITWLGND